MRRTILAVVCTTVVLTAAGCGSASRTETVRLQSANPLTADLYVRIKGPEGAVSYIAKRLRGAAFQEANTGAFAPPSRLHGRRPICSFTHTITSLDAPDIQRWQGKKVTLNIYGAAGIFCRALGSAIYQGSS